MSNELSKLWVVIGAKTDEFKTGLDKMKDQAAGFAGGVNKALGGILPAATVAGAVYTFTDMMKKAAAYGEEIKLAAQKTGMSIQMIQKLGYVDKLKNSSIGGLGTGMRKLSIALADAMDGSTAAQKSFDSLGLSIDDLQKMNPDERFLAVANALSQIEDPAKKTQAAVDLLGRAGQDLIPVIDEIQKLKDMNIPTINDADIESLDRGKESIEKMEAAWESLKVSFAATVWPNFVPLLDGLKAILDGIKGIDAAIKSIPMPWRNLVMPEGLLSILGKFSTGQYKIKGYAGGGIVTTPQLATVGEAGPEAIIPLSQLGGGGELHIHVDLDGEQVAEVVETRLFNRVNWSKGYV